MGCIRIIDSNTINIFVLRLSYENWENVFLEENVNKIFNNFLNTYLKIFYASFPIVKLKKSCKPKPWITKGIKVSCVKKRKLYLTYRNSNSLTIRSTIRNTVGFCLRLLQQLKNYIIINSY